MRYFGLLLIAALASFAGCVNPMNTQFPQPFPTNLQAEELSYRFHDPFPDNDIGPSTATRPPSYMQQRSVDRRAAENRMLRGYNLQQAPVSAVPPRAAYEYPDAVQTR